MTLIIGESRCDRGCCIYLGRTKDKDWWARVKGFDSVILFQTSSIGDRSGDCIVDVAKVPKEIYANYAAWRLTT